MQSRSSRPRVPAARTVRGAVEPEAIAIAESETYQTLLARVPRRAGGVPPASIVRHVLSVTHGGDWPVQRDALDAVLRRCASTHTDEIQIVAINTTVQRTASGGLVIEARAETASTLAALFSGMAQLLAPTHAQFATSSGRWSRS